ncbi:MAG: hypothetical protein P4L50_17160 [Anaerolineaceae bacterium]|nr:hypothetical protein [Anaerolineaceae bacterium]
MTKQQTQGILAWLGITVLAGLAGIDLYNTDFSIHWPANLLAARKYLLVLLVIIAAAVWAYSFWLIWKEKRPALLNQAQALLARTPLWLRGLLCLAVLLIPAYFFLYSPYGSYFSNHAYWFKLALICASALAAYLILFPQSRGSIGLLQYSSLVCLAGAIYTMGSGLNQVTNYPFSLGWSEGNRFWDYSMMFGIDRYIIPAGKPAVAFIEKGRQFLWSIPFLIPQSGIELMRLWDELVWIIPAFMLGIAAVAGEWHLAGKNGAVHLWAWEIFFGFWCYLFLTQGPIYPTLVLCAILVVIAVRLKKLWISSVLVLAAGYYAYISRWTWVYAPGLWAGMLALLDLQQPDFRNGKWKELKRPVILGLVGYFGGQFLPRLVNWATIGFDQKAQLGLVIDPTVNITRSALLWDRLLPNATFSTGILLGTLWAGVALVALLVWSWRQGLWQPNWLQRLGMLIPGLAFLGVGLVASIKIGGGGNLHNLDMFWVFLVLVFAWAAKEIMQKIPEMGTWQRNRLILLVCLTLVIPVSYNIRYGAPLSLPAQDYTQNALASITKNAMRYNQKGQVLFMDQRQLLAFGYIQGIPLISDYEKKYLMEQALENNANYFKQFNQDLANHRFVLIISEPLHIVFKGDDLNFGDENDDFVNWVSSAVLCYYQPIQTYTQVGVQLLVPRKQPLQDNRITCPR